MERFQNDDGTLDVAVLNRLFGGGEIVGVEERDELEGGGLVSGFNAKKLIFSDGSEAFVVVKEMPRSSWGMSKSMGLAREAHFYKFLGEEVGKFVSLPRCFAAFGDFDTGEKALVLEELTGCVQCGKLFGPGSPLNAGVDLEDAGRRASGWDARRATELAFFGAARLHRAFRGDEKLLEYAWLRGTAWVRGKGREEWESGVELARKRWLERGEKTEDWDPFVLECVESVLRNASWEKFLEDRDEWTLVQGDFHPGNALVKPDTDKIYFVDWEAVALGSGPQELSQWLISHATPEFRNECERDLLPEYAKAVDRDLETVRKEYVRGGVARWLWLLAILCGIVPGPALRYFHDQIRSFLLDHKVTVSTLPQIRP